MRDFKGMKRQRGRNRGGGQGGGKPQHNVNRAFDSQGPENIKIRGHAQHVYEKYSGLARDALLAGDRVLGENYMQHAEHYFRTLRAIQPNRPASDIAARDSFTSGIDIDFEDEALETAMEEADAQAAERAANGGAAQAQGSAQATGEGEAEGRGDRSEGRRDRYDQNRDRYANDRPDRNPGDRAQGERTQGERAQGERTQGERVQGEGDREFRRDRQNGEFRRDRQDPNRDSRDRGEFRRDRNERFDRGDRQERGDRQDRGERQERWSNDRSTEIAREPEAGEAAAFTPIAPVAAAPSAVLRSSDGEESHAPAFLGALAPAPAASPTEDPVEPRRTRTRTRRPRREEGEAPAAAPETEEA